MKALEEIINHLIVKTNNSKGDVKIPISKLLDIFHSETYLEFKNMAVKQHGKNRIFDFIFSQYAYMEVNL